ncbi:unnamed protein product [Eruca vesicaria subsp. sativa]|uniref:F-box domain-containing protein n=1 Tax=Eruca vesicaria subsp. sativa TaxID=29727 RepID=A0ABC8K0G8_ERUVS|nr:unnamed protein product [Eruca vesicaria subsp. sativa]
MAESSLIPGLTDDVAELCLSRIPRCDFRIISQVCRRWRTYLESEHFTAVRKLTGPVEEFLCVLMEDSAWGVSYWFGEVFDASGNNLGQIPRVPGTYKWSFGLAVLDGGKIVFIGGYYNDPIYEVEGLAMERTRISSSADVYEFDPAFNSWRKLAAMNIARHNFAFAVVDSLLYVLRGEDSDRNRLLSAEVYNPETNQWRLMDCPNRPVWGDFAFSFKSKLYVIEIYDPKTETWEELDSDQTEDVYTYTVIRNKVYFLERHTRGMGVFDLEENSWSWVSAPPDRYRDEYRFRLGEWNNEVIFIGRTGGRNALIRNLDNKENARKWIATPIKPSGGSSTNVLIKF